MAVRWSSVVALSSHIRRKKRHHRGDEIRVGNFPRATLGRFVAPLLEPLDEDQFIDIGGHVFGLRFRQFGDRILDAIEGRAFMGVQDLTCEFDANSRCVALHIGHEAGFHADKVFGIGV